MKHLICKKTSALVLSLIAFSVTAQTPKVVSGSIKRIEDFQSQFVEARNVDVWLPEGYSSNKKYSVLYMHDGQMLFDSTNTWNKTAWEADDVAAKLMSENKVKDFIIVGIWNGGKTRHSDYFPQKPFEAITKEQRDFITKQLQSAGKTTEVFQPQSDNYLKFIVFELKPYVDKTFSVRTDRQNTFIAGSSMGGLISLYAICEYPKIFGGAACLSTHWPGTFSVENNPFPDAMISYLQRWLPNAKKCKIYFDYGDQTLDALYPPLQKRIDQVMSSKGFTNKNWITKFFPGENHSEKAWSKRLNIPMLFLLKK
jgi:predicted alpha/beta superfamily hydrolase